MHAGIKDVADVCGVHISTVSRAFSTPHLVNPDTRARVLAVARELGYRPNRAARSLATGRTQNIGLIVADIGNPYFPPLIKSAHARAITRDYHLFVAETDEDPVVEQETVQAMAKQVDGILLASPRLSNRAIAEISLSIPLVLVNRSVSGVPAVLMNIGRGARLAIEHLTQLGHSRLALLTGPAVSRNTGAIRRTAASAAARAGASLAVIGPNPPTEAAGAAAAERILADGVSAVLAYNDLMAIGLIEGLESAGFEVPADISVVGIDDIGPSRLTRPRLTTVTMPTAEAGQSAVDILLQLVDGDDDQLEQEDVPVVRLETDLIIRGSTKVQEPRRREAL